MQENSPKTHLVHNRFTILLYNKPTIMRIVSFSDYTAGHEVKEQHDYEILRSTQPPGRCGHRKALRAH